LLTLIRLDDISSSDEDFREFKAGLTKAKYDTDIFRASRDQEDPNRQTTSRFRGSGRPKNDIAARGGYRGPRGPRLAAEPTGDIKARLAQASEAFLQADYHEAKAIATEIIRINAETHQAWTMLASCFYELDNRDRALTALTYAAHLEPKNIEGWLHCASVFLEETGTGKRRDKALQSAFFCYSAALKADPKDIPARLGKASIYIERNAPAGAVAEFKKIHALKPHDLDIIVNLCAAYYDHKEFGNARDLYKETFARLRADPDDLTDTLGWSDLNSYIAVYEQLGEHEAAIRELKSLSRWLLGRDSEEFWDNFTKDDREWDSDILRRVEVSDFQAESFPLDRYGDGLPLELRAKLGICRLELGHHDEAMVRSFFSDKHGLR
jgi:general transcription factor 3C polypeptide 3 (transcription factor C subunit 4)